MLKCNRRMVIWDIAYICYFASFFVSDMAFSSEVTQNAIEKTIRYLAYFLFVFVLYLNTTEKKTRILICLSGLVFAAFGTYFTHDLYFETLIFVAFSSYTIKPKHIVKISYYLLIALTLCTLLGVVLHIFPMINSPRGDGSGPRWGLGFYHSNVMPLVLLYIAAYSTILNYKDIKLWQIALWMSLNTVIYYICDSKNGLVSVALLCFGCLVFRKSKKEDRLILVMAEYLAIFLSVISLGGMLIQGKGGSFVELTNHMVTGRFGIAYRQYKSMGLHIVNRMDWATYKEMRQVLDNGYLYIAMRYGLAYLPFYWVVPALFAKKNKKNVLALIVIIIISLTNFIDNDFNSYGYLPFILIAFNKNSILESEKDDEVKRRRAWIS